MKKLLTALLMIGILISLFSVALAKDYHPGDTVEITYELDNTGKATGVDFQVTYDKSIFESNTQRIQKIDMNGNPLASGTIGTLILRIKDDASEGNYPIGYSNVDASDANGDVNVSIKAVPGSITVVRTDPSTPPPSVKPVDNPTTPPPTTKPADDPTTPPPTTKPADDPTTPPACPHTSVTWKKVKTADCTTEGLSEKSCDECGKVFDSEIIPAMGHDDGEWVVVRKATKTEDGLKQLVCTRKGCGEVLKEEIIPYVDSDWRMNQSVCSLGIRFRDIAPELTKKWYMFTPIDLSKDGAQTIDLIAANINYVGVVKVNVKGDKVTVNYTVRQPAEKLDMAFTILPDLANVTDVEIRNLNTYSFGKEISIADDLGGDTQVLLYVLGHVNYDFADERVELFIPRGPQYDTLVNSLKNLMD